MTSVDQEFRRRVARIPSHGIGLSVYVYAPDLFDLLEALEKRGLGYGYLELFKASSPALARVRRRVPTSLLEYHAASHLKTLGSYWISHECATKQMTYFGFGDLDIPDYFRLLTDSTPCGLALDRGHLWTVYRYSGDCEFVQEVMPDACETAASEAAAVRSAYSLANEQVGTSGEE